MTKFDEFSKRLKEIENNNNIGGEINVYDLIDDKMWLVSRVKKLEAALGFYAKTPHNGLSNLAKEALEGDE